MWGCQRPCLGLQHIHAHGKTLPKPGSLVWGWPHGSRGSTRGGDLIPHQGCWVRASGQKRTWGREVTLGCSGARCGDCAQAEGQQTVLWYSSHTGRWLSCLVLCTLSMGERLMGDTSSWCEVLKRSSLGSACAGAVGSG